MYHKKGYRRFGIESSHRRAMFRNMATSLLKQERCLTTVAKAKDLRRIVERLITSARKDTLHARREAYSYLLDKAVVHKLFAEIAPRYLARNGGYTRIVRADYRHGDAAERAYIELLQDAAPAAKKSAGKRGKRKSKTSAAASEATGDSDSAASA